MLVTMRECAGRFPRNRSERVRSVSRSKWAACAALVFLVSFFSAPGSWAHPVSLTSVFVNVEHDKITAELSMFVEDLILYYWMDTDEDFRFPANNIKTQAVVHKDFLLRYFQVRDHDGNRFDGTVVDIDFSELSDDGVHIDDLMAYSIRYRFEFPFDEAPEFLTVAQNFGGDSPAVPSEMNVRFFHHGLQMESAILSHGTAHTVHLDWDAGWEYARDDIEAARERLRLRREEALGITSYSAVYSYVYITDTEVRHEILIPLLTLETWLHLGREDTEVMTVAEQEAARDPIHAFLDRHNRVEINGAPVPSRLERLDFFGPDYRDFARTAPATDVSVYNARVGAVLAFPADETPESVGFEWDYFNERLPVFRPAIFVFDEDRKEIPLDPRQVRFEWESAAERESLLPATVAKPPSPPLLRLPVLSLAAGILALALAGAGTLTDHRRRRLFLWITAGVLLVSAAAALPYAHASVPHPFRSAPHIDDEAAHAVFEALHENIYKAFNFRREERIYDALSRSVDGQLLENLYLQIRRNLSVQEQGGAVSRVDDIRLLEGRSEPVSRSPAGYRRFVYRSTWTVSGTVEHWGHVHTRKNRYEGIFTIDALPTGWKITGFEPITEERIDRQIRLRR